MRELPPALAPLASFSQFLCYALVPSASRPGKMDKLPISPRTGAVCSAHDAEEWVSADVACATATAWGAGYGVAFVFTDRDPFFFVDIDGCYDGSAWSPLALKIAGMFPGAAMEVSQSGHGMHIFGTGHAPTHAKKNAAHGLEFYTELRFVALTGVGCVGSAATDCTVALHALTAEYFAPGASADGDFSLSDAPVPEWRGPTSDADLVRRALMSRSAAAAFGRAVSFADLWEGNADALGKAYPDGGGRAYDASQADAALVSHLAFWTGRHGERIKRLMLQSGLAREKWEREDYLPRTIAEILARPGDVLQDKPVEAPNATPAPAAGEDGPLLMRDVTGETFLSPEQQKAIFQGCVYVQDRHRVLVPGGMLLKPDQFRASFGGYLFAMDTINEKITRNAWEAFTESQALRPPKASTVCFRPDLTPGTIVSQAGRSYANTWWPATVARKAGDITPFLTHLAKVLPNEGDQRLLLGYMAACVQHIGVKFQWCPVLQGCEGNGKSFFSTCVAEAVGQHYTHWPHASDIASPFNGYLAKKVFIALEELHSTEHAFSTDTVVERLKTMITGGMGIQIQHKGIDQESASICANFMATTNYKTAIRKTPDNSRRFALFFTAQQTKADKIRDGLDGAYFQKLWNWARADGYAIITEFLHTYQIPPECNPALGSDAPHTSTTNEAIRESRGGVEQQIAEAIAQDTPGFMGGWVSSNMLDRLITETLRLGAKISHNRRRELMQGMGYVLHPGLPEGRVNNPVQPDGRKPQLFILADHPSRYLTGPAEIAKAYTAAQMPK